MRLIFAAVLSATVLSGNVCDEGVCKIAPKCDDKRDLDTRVCKQYSKKSKAECSFCGFDWIKCWLNCRPVWKTVNVNYRCDKTEGRCLPVRRPNGFFPGEKDLI